MITMKTSQLKILLSKLEGFTSPDPSLEQYITPPGVAADVLNIVRMHHDTGTLVDLGCGTGILSIGAAALGFNVTGYDIDTDAIATAEENRRKAEQEIEELDIVFKQADVTILDTSADIALTNPPFGIQQQDANLDFLNAGFKVAPSVFALLHQSNQQPAKTRKFIKDFASQHGFDCAVVKEYSFPLPRSMSFHEQDRRTINVDLYHFQHIP